MNEWVRGFLACAALMAAFGGLAALAWAVREVDKNI